MPIAHPSELKSFLECNETFPRKGLSQNFLIDANVVRNIVKAAEIAPGDCILEIGPGPGALTEEILKAGANVIAIEKDPKLAEALMRLPGSLKVHTADFLDFPLRQLPGKMKVVANLPYHIASPILEKLCEHHFLFSSAVVMVQKELALRMAAHPGTKEIGSFTIFLKTYCQIRTLMSVSRHCFYPAPKVDSAVVRLDFQTPILADPRPFLEWMRRAFQQRRKMLRSTLSVRIESFASKRPEDLSFDDWLTLWKTVSSIDS